MQTNADSLSGELPRKRKKKKDISHEQLLENKVLSNLISEALLANAQKNKEKFYKEDCAQAVIAVLGEFLQSYILIGYDFDGTPIKIAYAHNAMESDALISALQKFMINIAVNDGV